jgi:hypothetical protein
MLTKISHKSDILYGKIEDCGSPAGAQAARAPSSPDKMPTDRVTLSGAALQGTPDGHAAETIVTSEQELSSEQRQVVDELKKLDLEVKAHEQAHMAAGGPVVQGGAVYQYQNGPDGKMYAVSGEVKIDVSPERTPEATIRKMQQIRRAALAPAQPSSTDRAVAAQALQIEAQARMESNAAEKSEIRETAANDPLPPLDAARSSTAATKQTPQLGSRIDRMA